MIIHSKFTDYYDRAQMYGHDDTRRYIRKTEEIKHGQEFFEVYPSMSSTSWKQTPVYIGFCGWLYAAFRLQYGYKQFDRTFYTAEDLESYIYRIKGKFLREEEIKRYERDSYYWKLGRRMTTFEYNKEFFKRRAETQMFFDLGTPVFVITKDKIITNPNLSDYEFYRMFPAPQAFQEIDMYLSGVLGQAHPPMVSISDESMRDKKGFDEWSFKTRPTKRAN